MKDHLKALGVASEDVIVREAWSFDTFGEASALGSYLDPGSVRNPHAAAVDEVYVAVKW